MGLLARLAGISISNTKSSESPPEITKPCYRGVRVVANGDECCQAVKTIADERYLLEETPMLPLSLCDAAVCNCTYERFDDRREGFRRTSDITFDMAGHLHDNDNRSSKSPGRRSRDTD